LLKKYDAADKALRALEEALRGRLDLIAETDFIGEKIFNEREDIRDIYNLLIDLCDDCRFAETAVLLRSYDEIEEKLRELAETLESAVPDEGAPDMGFLTPASERVRETGRVYNESLSNYFKLAGKAPYIFLAGLFLLKHEEIYINV
jgi:hypothetical protein